ncbi:hypothetical protein PLESTF_001423100 [Pleodorina starrii]|nr:hypothetical protein PLESTF_001423100 [Pleodorina starrii]
MQQPQPQRQMRCQQPLPPDQCRLQCRRHQQLQQQQQQSQQQSQQQQQPSGSAASTATTAPGEDGEGHGGGCAAEPELRAGGPPPGSSPAGSGSGLPAAAEATGKQPPAAAASDQRADGSAAASGGGGLPPDPGSLESVRSYVADAMVRQGRFLHQILRYFYQDPGFLESGRTRYLRFLALARTQAPDAPLLVPMYDQDIMWHSHMALSGAYVADCGALMPGGRPLGHDDSLSAVSLSDPFAFTMGRYEKATGLMVNPSPSRRIPTFIAQPLVGQLWPLAAALADPRVAELPPPRKIAAELRVGGGGMQHTQTQTQQRRRDDRSGKGGGGGGGGGGSYSRSGVFVGDPDAAALAGPGRAGRPAMLGSPDHLCRSGAFAVYALWCLAERLQLGGSAGDEDEEKEGKEGRRGEGKVGGVVAEEARNAPASGRGGGLGRRLFGGCFPGSTAAGAVEKKEEEGGCDAGPSRAELDAAISHMTQQLLRLTDLNDPTSPLASHRHRFWDDIAPMPPPQPRPPLQSPQQTPPPPPPPPPPPQQRASSSSTPSSSSSDPSVAAAAPYPPFAAAVTAAAGGGASGGCRRRHPAPAPPLDLPCSFLTPSERSAEPTYLAPHHPAVRGQVYYTPSDFCLLGPGRCCKGGRRCGAVGGTAADETMR